MDRRSIVQRHVGTQEVVEGDEQDRDGNGAVASGKTAGRADMVLVGAV